MLETIIDVKEQNIEGSNLCESKFILFRKGEKYIPMIIVTEDWDSIQKRSIDPYSTVTSDNVNAIHLHMGASNMFYTGFDYRNAEGSYYFEVDTVPSLGLHLTKGTVVKDNVSIAIDESCIHLIYGDIPTVNTLKHVCIKYQYVKQSEPPIASIVCVTDDEYNTSKELFFILYSFYTGSKVDWVDPETGIYKFPTVSTWIQWCEKGKWLDRRYETGPLFRNNDTANTCIKCNGTPTDNKDLTTKKYVDDLVQETFDPNRFVRRTIEGSITEQIVEPKLKYLNYDKYIPETDEFVTRHFTDQKYLPLYLEDDTAETVASLNGKMVTFTQPIIVGAPLTGGSVNQAATLQYVQDAIQGQSFDERYVLKTGDTMQGPLTFDGTQRQLLYPDDNEYITKYYLDNTRDLPIATKKKLGTIMVGDGLEIDQYGTLSVGTDSKVPIASEDTVGGIKLGRNIHVTSSGQAWVPPATKDFFGTIKSGGDIDIDTDGKVTIIPRPATMDGNLGAVTVTANHGLTLNENGDIRVIPATYGTIGGVVVDNDTLEIGADGLLRVRLTSIPIATNTVLGGIKTSTQILTDEDGVATVGIIELDQVNKLENRLSLKADLVDGVVPISQIPATVKGVVEGYYISGQFYKDSAGTILIIGEAEKLYIDLNTSRVYRWNGTQYITLSSSLELGETSTTAYRGDRGKAAYDHSTITGSNPHATTFANIVDNIATATKLGGVKVGNNLSITADGTLSAVDSYVLPIATDIVLGGVKVASDSSIAIDAANGFVTVKDNSHNHTIANITNLQTALDNKLETSLKGAAGGLAELGADGKVPSGQLPSYVDGIIEGYFDGTNFYKDAAHTELITPETKKIYVDLHTDKTYRWGGTVYVEISSSLALGETETTAYRGDRGKAAYDHSILADGTNPHATTFANIVDNIATTTKLGGVKVGSNLAVGVDGTISGDYAEVTTTTPGLMSAADKVKLDNISYGTFDPTTGVLRLNIEIH